MPPDLRNHLVPTGADTPAATAASSLDRPWATAAQNTTSVSRRAASGRPGECSFFRPDPSDRRLRVVIATSLPECCDDRLRPPIIRRTAPLERALQHSRYMTLESAAQHENDPISRMPKWPADAPGHCRRFRWPARTTTDGAAYSTSRAADTDQGSDPRQTVASVQSGALVPAARRVSASWRSTKRIRPQSPRPGAWSMPCGARWWMSSSRGAGCPDQLGAGRGVGPARRRWFSKSTATST